jgi:hypothetical protein
MIARKVMSRVALALGVLVVAAAALAANPCRPAGPSVKSCRNEIRNCAAPAVTRNTGTCFDVVLYPKKRDRARCIARAKRDCRRQYIGKDGLCRADPTVCTGSPSGAFLDSVE